MLNSTRNPCIPSSAGPPGSPVLSAHPKARALMAHHMPCGFPIRGWGLGFPGQGISCSPRGGGRGAGRTQPLRIPGIPGGSPSQLLPGALAQCHAVPAWQSSIPLGVPLGSEVTGRPLSYQPYTPQVITEAEKAQPRKERFGVGGGV